MSQNNVINSPKPTTIANGGTGQVTETAAVDVLIMGASLTAVSPVSNDKVIYQDTSDSNHPKTATPVEIANLANALNANVITAGTLVHERGGLEADVSAYDGFIRIASGATTNIKANFAASSAPTTGDDSGDGYSIGSRWLDTTADKEYVCLDASLGAAVWKETSNAAATVSVTEYEADFGSTGVTEGTFTVTDASVSGTSKIMATMSGAAPTGKDADEVTNFETGFDIYCTPGTGQFTLNMRAHEGDVNGKFKINYIVG